MRLFFLGTAAAEGFPGIFCDCANCREARAQGGRSLRFRSGLLVNDDLLIDFGPDLGPAAQKFNLTLARVSTGLVTHAHSDHFYIENFNMRRRSFTGGLALPKLHVYGPPEATEALVREAQGDPALLSVDPHTVHAFERWQHAGYTFESFRAYHAIGILEALFYSISDGQHAFLYATDTGSFPADTWQALAGKSYDTIILEETLGNGSYDQHLSFITFLEHAHRMRAEGMLRPGGRFVAHHFSHSDNPVHEKLAAFFAPHGVEAAYDGMEINL
jgi:phosphoribosyl 1,2-cyclic phosphate phosphodiesterase